MTLVFSLAIAALFAVGAFLNLSQDHLDFHPDMEDYFRAKCRLFDAGADPEIGRAHV